MTPAAGSQAPLAVHVLPAAQPDCPAGQGTNCPFIWQNCGGSGADKGGSAGRADTSTAAVTVAVAGRINESPCQAASLGPGARCPTATQPEAAVTSPTWQGAGVACNILSRHACPEKTQPASPALQLPPVLFCQLPHQKGLQVAALVHPGTPMGTQPAAPSQACPSGQQLPSGPTARPWQGRSAPKPNESAAMPEVVPPASASGPTSWPCPMRPPASSANLLAVLRFAVQAIPKMVNAITALRFNEPSATPWPLALAASLLVIMNPPSVLHFARFSPRPQSRLPGRSHCRVLQATGHRTKLKVVCEITSIKTQG